MPELKERLLGSRRRLVKYAALAAACAVGLGLVGTALARSAGAQQQVSEERVYRVSALQVSPTGNDVYLEYTGLIQPAATEQCTFGAIGNIEAIYVKEGDQVHKGQVLAAIDPEDAQRQADSLKQVADQADRAVETAQKARDDAQSAYDQAREEASDSDLSAAKSALDAAKASRDAKKAELEGYNAQAAADQAALGQADQAVTDAQAAVDAARQKLEDAEKARAAIEADPAATPEQKEQAKQAVEAAAAELKKKENDLTTAQAAQTAAAGALAASKGKADAAQTELTALEAEVAARQTAYDGLKSQGGESGAASLQKQRLDAAESALSAAKSAQLTARANYESAAGAVQDCQLKAHSDGYVVKVVGSEGSLATPLSPVLVLGSRDAVARFGVSQSDVRSLAPGQSATVTIEGGAYAGKVKNIAVLPDEATRTYAVDVAIEADTGELYLGEMASVKIGVGERTGVWLPLAVVLNDGEDYVYLVENDRAVRRAVTLLDVSDDMVLVSGLENGGRVISEGMKTVRSGSAVSVG